MVFVGIAFGTGTASANNPFGEMGKKLGEAAKKEGTEAARAGANRAVVSKVNSTLMKEGRKNQCSFVTDSDQLAPGCDKKAERLANVLVESKKVLAAGGVSGFKFVVIGHTDTRGDADHNKMLSQKRAAAIVRELVSRGVPAGEIEALGMGADRPLVKKDNTPAKRAKNRRYEIQVKI